MSLSVLIKITSTSVVVQLKEPDPTGMLTSGFSPQRKTSRPGAVAGGGVCRGRARRLEQYWSPLAARVNFAAYAPADLVAALRVSAPLISQLIGRMGLIFE